MTASSLSLPFSQLYEKAIEIGYEDAAWCSATIPSEDQAAYEKWIAKGMHADLSYMTNRARLDPRSYYPQAESALLFASYYKQPKEPFLRDKGLIASYARGRDYHNLHTKRNKAFLAWLRELTGVSDCGRGFSDSFPIMEKALAVRSGMGWFGKNSLIIHRKLGTFFLLAGCLLPFKIKETRPSPRVWGRSDRCGSCSLCIESCPTSALTPFTLDSARCLSYQTIENQKQPPIHISMKNPGYIFGCDICQDVCPHNRRSPLTQSADFSPAAGVGTYLEAETLKNIEIDALYGTPLKRAGISKLQSTLQALPYAASHTYSKAISRRQPN